MTRWHVRWYVGGISAGHIHPLLVYARQDRAQDHAPVLQRGIFGSTPLDYTLSVSSAIDVRTHLQTRGVRRRTVGGYIQAIMAIARDVITLMGLWWRERPREIITTGGGLAVPALLVAAVTRTPVRLYELNAVPGRAVAWGHWWGWPVYCVFPQVCADDVRYIVPYPLAHHSQRYDRVVARARYGLQPDVLTVVVLGGSQGSAWLNRHVPAWLHHIRDTGISVQVIHQTGAQVSEVQEVYAQMGIAAHVISFESDMGWMYAAADVVICRAGSGTLHEVGYFDIPALVVPLPEQVTDHQVANARAWCAACPARRRWVTQEAATSHELESMLSAN